MSSSWSLDGSVRSQLEKVVNNLSDRKLPIDTLRCIFEQSKLMLATAKARQRFEADPWGAGLLRLDGSGSLIPSAKRMIDSMQVISYEESIEVSAAYIRATTHFSDAVRLRTQYRREKFPGEEETTELVEYVIDISFGLHSAWEKLLDLQFRWNAVKGEVEVEEPNGASSQISESGPTEKQQQGRAIDNNEQEAGREGDDDENPNVNVGFDIDLVGRFATATKIDSVNTFSLFKEKKLWCELSVVYTTLHYTTLHYTTLNFTVQQYVLPPKIQFAEGRIPHSKT